jgi:hypothetical protein
MFTVITVVGYFLIVVGLIYAFVWIYLGITAYFEYIERLSDLEAAVKNNTYQAQQTDSWTLCVDENAILLISIPSMNARRFIKADLEGKILSHMWWGGSSRPHRLAKRPPSWWCKRAEKFTGQIAVMHKISHNNEK